jgi:hypothetical protein
VNRVSKTEDSGLNPGAEDPAMAKLLRAGAALPGRRAADCSGFDPDLANAYLERILEPGEIDLYERHLSVCDPCRSLVIHLARSQDGPLYVGEMPYWNEDQPEGPTSALRPSWRSRLAAGVVNLTGARWLVPASLAMVALIFIPLAFLWFNGSLGNRAIQIAETGRDDSAKAQPAASNPLDSTRNAPAGAAAIGGNGAGAAKETGEGAESSSEKKDRETAGDKSPRKASGPESESAARNETAKDAANREESGQPAERVKTSDALAKAPATGDAPAAPPAALASRSADSGRPDSGSKSGKAKSETAAAGPKSSKPADRDQAGDQDREDNKDRREADAQTPEGQVRRQEKAAAGGLQDSGQNSQASGGTRDSQKPLPRIDPEKAKRLPQDEKAAEVSVLKEASPAEDASKSREKAGTIKQQEAPTPDSSEELRRRAIARGPAGSNALAAGKKKASEKTTGGRSSSADQAKDGKIERMVEGKRFRFVDGIWMDRAYKPSRDVPSVTLIRGSAVYKELLIKQAGLKPYFDGFPAGDQFILVYKKMVYKVIPPTR